MTDIKPCYNETVPLDCVAVKEGLTLLASTLVRRLVGLDDPVVIKKIVAEEVRQCVLQCANDDSYMEIQMPDDEQDQTK